nr:MAG TPA: hypothetical protein [Caudoviricetes sp.]
MLLVLTLSLLLLNSNPFPGEISIPLVVIAKPRPQLTSTFPLSTLILSP